MIFTTIRYIKGRPFGDIYIKADSWEEAERICLEKYSGNVKIEGRLIAVIPCDFPQLGMETGN
jgi:hypothetical protein